MKTIVSGLTVLAVASSAMAIYTVAPYGDNLRPGPQTWWKTWTFDNDMEGWTTVAAGSGAANWSSSYGGTFYNSNPGTGNYGFAQLDLTNDPQLKDLGPSKPFIIQCDILMPSYTGAGNVKGAHPGALSGQGLSMLRNPANGGDQRGPALGGTTTGVQFRDRSWDNVNRGLGFSTTSNTPNVYGSDPPITETWFKLQIDYGVAVPGKMNAWIYSPVPTGRDANPAGAWMQVVTNADVHINVGEQFELFKIGGLWRNAGGGAESHTGVTPFGFSYIDNVRIVPEPTSLLLLAIGTLGLIRRR